MNFPKLQHRWIRFRRGFWQFSWGGAWAAALPAEKRQNLTIFFYDGLFAAASDKIILTYITIYLLSLGASGQLIGLLSSLSNFAAALLLLPAAMLVERSGERKRITLATGSGSRSAVFLMALLPFFLGRSSALIWVIFALALIREVLNHLGYPGWMSLTGDIVPIRGRGRYFGTRNFIMGVAGILSALLVGELITRIGEPLGYQLAFLLAAGLGAVSIFFFAQLKDPHSENKTIHQVQSGFFEILDSIKGQKQFLTFCAFTAVWNFSINIAGPFFSVFMVETINLTAAMIGVTAVANTIANLVIQRRIGDLADKWGSRKLAIVYVFLIPVMPLVWGLWVRQYWQVILMQSVAGFLWGGYNLVSFNNLLLQTPPEQRARFSAFFQIVVTLSLAGGAALGAFLYPRINFPGVTFMSAGGRWLAAILFLTLVREPSQSNAPDLER